MKWCGLFVAMMMVGAACGADGGEGAQPDASPSNDGGAEDAAGDGRPQDPADPVEDVPAHAGPYGFGKLTTQDSFTLGDSGTWFTDAMTEHRVTTTRVRYARYRDQMVLLDKISPRVFVYDQSTTTISDPITLPSDAVGLPTIRGGLIYIGGLSKVYSYEIATQMWRMRDLPGAGTCLRVTAGATRLFVMCASATEPNTDVLFSTWANKSMSDVVPLGSVTPSAGTELVWLTSAPGEDIAYFDSRSSSEACVGKVTATTFEPCAIDVRTLGNELATAFVADAAVSEDGQTLYASVFTSSSDRTLYAIQIGTKQYRRIRTIDSFATCPDNSVIYQDGTISERYAGGVATSVRLGNGGQSDMGCPLRPL